MRRGGGCIIGVIIALVVIFVVFRRFGTQRGIAADEQCDASGASEGSHAERCSSATPVHWDMWREGSDVRLA